MMLAPEARGVPGTPEARGIPGTPEARGIPGTPEARGIPGAPEARGIPGTPEARGIPGAPDPRHLPGEAEPPHLPYAPEPPRAARHAQLPDGAAPPHPAAAALPWLLAALVAALAMGINAVASDRLLRADAERRAEALAAELSLRLAGAEAEIPIGAAAPGLLGWRVLDATGQEMLAASAGATAAPFGATAGIPGPAGAVRVPMPGGAVLEAAFDQSAAREMYHGSLLAAELMMAGLGGAATLGLLALGRRRRRLREAEARMLARHDPMTGLANDAGCRERLEEALALARRHGWHVGLIVLDLRHFRELNEAHGRAAGDALLREVALRLRQAVRREDAVARLAADRFAVLQTGLRDPSGAARLAERLAAAIAQPVRAAGKRICCAADVGIAIAPADGDEPGLLLARAEEALAAARASTEPAIRCFAPGQDAALARRRRLLHDLREAVAEGQFSLHWQPQRRLCDRRLIGFEALLRWHHPSLGMVPPDEFIPLAESSGLIVPLGAWVIRAATAEAARWPGGFKAAVNLSAAQVRAGGLIETVTAALAESGLPPAHLELEVTESLLLREVEAAAMLLTELRGLGVGVAMDDFGTGWSSLANLWRFPFTRLKVDRAFIRPLPGDARAGALVSAILAMGRSLDVEVVAEGVETEEQAAMLAAAGCVAAQGWLLGRPAPAEVARALIAEEMRAREAEAA